MCSFRGGFLRVHWCRRAGFRGSQDLPELALVLWSCVPCFLSSLRLCLWHIMLEYGSISRFKGVFSAVWCCCVGLLGFGGLRGLCGFCARVELGGLKAHGVFASIYSFICLRFSSFILVFALLLCSLHIFWGFVFVVLGLSSCLPCLFLCGCGFLWVCCCFLFFPFGLYAKKKGRKVFASSLALLWVVLV